MASSSSGPIRDTNGLKQTVYTSSQTPETDTTPLSLLEALPQDILECIFTARNKDGTNLLTKRDLAQVASTSKTLYTSSLEAASHLECSQTHAFINALL
ncbi:MAG: F-box protein, partial [Rhabdochlamydiaceae bacterium]|nr:F-box protein [Rhabdochlamydiaceae bacterium]